MTALKRPTRPTWTRIQVRSIRCIIICYSGACWHHGRKRPNCMSTFHVQMINDLGENQFNEILIGDPDCKREADLTLEMHKLSCSMAKNSSRRQSRLPTRPLASERYACLVSPLIEKFVPRPTSLL